MSLSYTTGNPNNLTGGSGASMTDISGPFTDIKTFLTDGSGAVGDTILASPTNGVWRTVLSEHVNTSGVNTGTWYYGQSGANAAFGSVQAGITTLWVPPSASDVAVAGKTTRLRLRVSWAMNATSALINLIWGLYPIATLAGGAFAITPTNGTVIAGSTATATAPAGGGAGVATGASFDFSAVTGSATGAYCIGVTGSGTMNTGSYMACQLALEMRHT